MGRLLLYGITNDITTFLFLCVTVSFLNTIAKITERETEIIQNVAKNFRSRLFEWTLNLSSYEIGIHLMYLKKK